MASRTPSRGSTASRNSDTLSSPRTNPELGLDNLSSLTVDRERKELMITEAMKEQTNQINGCGCGNIFKKLILMIKDYKTNKEKSKKSESKKSKKIPKNELKESKISDRVLFVGRYNDPKCHEMFLDCLSDFVWQCNPNKIDMILNGYLRQNGYLREYINVFKNSVIMNVLSEYLMYSIHSDKDHTIYYNSRYMSLSYLNYNENTRREYKKFEDSMKIFVLSENEYIGEHNYFGRLINDESHDESNYIIFVNTNKNGRDLDAGNWAYNNEYVSQYLHVIPNKKTPLDIIYGDLQTIITQGTFQGAGLLFDD